jgi:hypothetical protein
MNFFRTPGLLRALRNVLLSGRRDQARAIRVITVPAPLSRPTAEAVRLPVQPPPRVSSATRCKLSATKFCYPVRHEADCHLQGVASAMGGARAFVLTIAVLPCA